MGKVLNKFTNGWPGSVSRSIDDIIISMKNGSSAVIPFGAAVFLQAGGNSCLPFNAESSSADDFVGFSVRIPSKTPETYGSNEGRFSADDPVEVLVRGSIVLTFAYTVVPGEEVYIRKSDGAFVSEAGASGSTIKLPNVRVKTSGDSENRAEVVVLTRNLM